MNNNNLSIIKEERSSSPVSEREYCPQASCNDFVLNNLDELEEYSRFSSITSGQNDFPEADRVFMRTNNQLNDV